jgi:hypothetical protein
MYEISNYMTSLGNAIIGYVGGKLHSYRDTNVCSFFMYTTFMKPNGGEPYYEILEVVLGRLKWRQK